MFPSHVHVNLIIVVSNIYNFSNTYYYVSWEEQITDDSRLARGSSAEFLKNESCKNTPKTKETLK